MSSLLIKVYHRYLDCFRLNDLTSFLTFVAIFSVKYHILGAKIQITNFEFPRLLLRENRNIYTLKFQIAPFLA